MKIYLPLTALTTAVLLGAIVGVVIATSLEMLALHALASAPTPSPVVVVQVITATPNPATPTPNIEATPSFTPAPTLTPGPKSVAIANDSSDELTATYTFRNEQGTPTLTLKQIILPRESITITRGSKYSPGIGP